MGVFATPFFFKRAQVVLDRLVEKIDLELGNLIVIANKYNIPLDEVFLSHK